ncbi:topoisomerase II-associated protein PAT1 [Podospora australis]|uniref:Topoisomerase II-associated protein PAT1 n=1 Tax=Podospora australis TaxID=1536484 RepID=A0AAN6WU13_9PEZI|nr:topoisomerase II-associated protein PAT1 [Podospora australis]
MSFFGFDSNRHNTAAAGFSQAHNPFAGLSIRDDEGDALDFEDTYDGLGDQLEETNDAFNDDTFGDSSGVTAAPVGTDFDFFNQTAKVSEAIEEEHFLFNRQQPAARAAQPPHEPPRHPQQSFGYQQPAAPASYGFFSQPQQPSKPVRTGYEKYNNDDNDLQVNAALWGVAPKRQQAQAAPSPQPPAPTASSIPASRKVMSLEEVEAQMRAQVKASAQQTTQSPAPQPQAPSQLPYDPAIQFAQPASADQLRHKELGYPSPGHASPVAILQRPQSKHAPSPQPPPQPVSHPHQQQQSHQQHPQHLQHQRQQSSMSIQPTQILQNPNRLSGEGPRLGAHQHPTPPIQGPFPFHPGHRPQGSFGRQGNIITHPAQLAQLSEEEKAAYMDQEARRAKRNHKIFLMSRDNGIMTPQDKSFVTRIQLQQLVAATGNPNEHGTDESLAEDFYYQVYSQIQGVQRQNPNQPLNNFAQTYLFQTGNRQGNMRRHHRGPENHMQRMEQQVQRAVEAAKNKPKNKQLVIEGSLGKISFSNAKTPKPLLNIKRTDSTDQARPSSAHRPIIGGDRKSELRSIERIYATLMKMEDHDRTMPPAPPNDSDAEAVERFVAWSNEAQALNAALWTSLRTYDHPEPGYVHPFVALLSYSKGKKAMNRIFRHLTQEQRTAILTLIVVNLDNLDVVRNAQVTPAAVQLNASMRENVELFSVAVMSTLLNFLNDLGLDLVAGVLGLICTRNVDIIAKSRIGASMITMILSRAEIIRHSKDGNEQLWRTWDVTYDQFFDKLEPTLPHMFPGPVTASDDVYVWQLLAALGIGASPDQQQRLVLAVKDRVMDTVALAKTLPPDLGAQRLQNVNLFMRSIGLDVELLQ